MQLNCWSLRCSWSITCRRCSNHIFILDLTPGFNGLGKDICKTRRESFKFWDLVCLILEILRYFFPPNHAFFPVMFTMSLMQWILSQPCGYWWPGALAPGHQYPQCFECTHVFPAVYGLSCYQKKSTRNTSCSVAESSSNLWIHSAGCRDPMKKWNRLFTC